VHLVQRRLRQVETMGALPGTLLLRVILLWLRLQNDWPASVLAMFRHAPQTTTPAPIPAEFHRRATACVITALPKSASPFDNGGMVRPCFLVIDREYSGSISTRKLVIETAKFNVVTSYSAVEAIETLQAFPNMRGIVLDAGIRDMTCCDLVAKLKEIDSKSPVVVISAPGTHDCPQADHLLESFEPAKLLSLLQSLAPAETAAIEKRNEHLTKTQS
jgi:CheY-like chemotaxis protein